LKVERRRFKRHIVPENGFEVSSRELKINGKLKDISKGGLSYQYTPINGGDSRSEVVDILVEGTDRFFLPGLACNRIYNITELAADRTFTGAEIRIRGLEYVGLTEEQTRKIESLIEKVFFKTTNR
jgi:hypothetical protein